MFETLYKDPATIERYRLAPLLEDRERYLCAVLASSVVGDVARRVARTQLRSVPAPVMRPVSISHGSLPDPGHGRPILRASPGLYPAPRHERCESGQRAQIHLGALLNAHPGAGHAVEHPERNFPPETRDSLVHGTSRASDARPLYDIANPDMTAAPGMPRVQDRPSAGPMGGLALACTARSAHMAACDTGRRLRRRSSCQAGRPAPLRSAGHPAWPGNPQCTNIRTGPVDRGRSVGSILRGLGPH